MKILGLAADRRGCGYYRIELPLGELAEHGHHVDICDSWDDEPVSRIHEFDVAVGQRLGNIGEYERWLRLAEHSRLVYEVDDDLLNVDPSNVRAHNIMTDPDLRRGTAMCAAMADLVTVTTQHLADVMGQWNPNVAVLPNHIDQTLLDMERPRPERITIGWSGGGSHIRDLQLVARQVDRFLGRNPEVDLHIVGTDYTQLFRSHVRHTPFDPNPRSYFSNIDFDIGLAPLVPSRFNRSKSHIRVLEYAALGIPVVASDEPAYRETVIDGVTGFLVRYEHEWNQRLRDLVEDEEMRNEMSIKAREHARSWVIQDGWRKWEQAYEGILQ